MTRARDPDTQPISFVCLLHLLIFILYRFIFPLPTPFSSLMIALTFSSVLYFFIGLGQKGASAGVAEISERASGGHLRRNRSITGVYMGEGPFAAAGSVLDVDSVFRCG